MPDKEQQESLSELLVREAVGKGMESPMRETIVEAVEEAEGGGRSRLPLIGALVGMSAAAGYLLGTRDTEAAETVQTSIDEIAETEPVEEVTEELTEETSEETEGDSGGRRFPRKLVLLGAAIAGVVLARRRLQSGDVEEWEPIEEFESAIGSEGEEDEEADEETEAGDDEEMASEEGEEMDVEEAEGEEADADEEFEETEE